MDVERYMGAGDWIDATAGQQLRDAASLHPAKPAVRGHDGDLTFAELNFASESLAASLIKAGLNAGDRAIIQIGTVKELFVVLYACFKAGVIPVCTMPQHREIEIGNLARRSKAKAIFAQADAHPTFDQAAFARRMKPLIPTMGYIGITRGDAASGEFDLDEMTGSYSYGDACSLTESRQASAADVMVFQLSGGSTGLPRIIPRMHGEYLAQSRAIARRYELTKDDVSLWTLPLIHNAGMLMSVLPTVAEGRTAVILPRFEIRSFLEAIARYRVTFTGSVGPVAPRLLELKDVRNHDLSSLRQFFCMSRADATEDHVGVVCINQFGITEGLILASAPTDNQDARHRSNGWPTGAADEIRLLQPGTDEPVQSGEVGELCFRGASRCVGYYDEQEGDRNDFTADGFFRTGDLMKELRIGERAYYVFEGRIKDNINRGGEKIGAEEIERLLSSHSDIADVRVTSMPDRIYGEKVCAFIIPRPGRAVPGVAELGRFLLGLGLAKYKLPERIEAVTGFPLTAVGKVDKAKLRAMIAAKLQSELSASA